MTTLDSYIQAHASKHRRVVVGSREGERESEEEEGGSASAVDMQLVAAEMERGERRDSGNSLLACLLTWWLV